MVSLALAALSKRGHLRQKAEDFFVASGQFNTVLFFFLAVGETYSITTVLGYPGGVYASGTGFVTWFVGYILLAFVVGYFLNPLIWRAGRDSWRGDLARPVPPPFRQPRAGAGYRLAPRFCF